MQIIVASKNPVKINAVREWLVDMFPDHTLNVVWESFASGVSDQPMTDTETYQWAYNRAHNAYQKWWADLYVGLEWWLEEQDWELLCFAWIVIIDAKQKIWKAKTATFILPAKISELIHQWKELGEADDIVFGHTNSKQSMWAVGILTKW